MTTTVAPLVGPQATLGCPAETVITGTQADATFSHQVTEGSAPIVSYAIDYGDGRSYANDSPSGVFTHRYADDGTYTVRLDVTDANGLVQSASCVWAFTLFAPPPPPPVTTPIYTPPPSSGGSGGGCGAGYYENVDGNCIPSPGSSPSGATARCQDGTYSYSQHRQGTCSGHGGVAVWL